MLYFAYGSNMHPQQMRRRCPGYRFISTAKLKDHKLAFTRRSTRRRCGVADVISSPGDEVWGVLYHLKSRQDIHALDKAEGFKLGRKRINNYDRERRNVWSPLSPHKPLSADTYIARQHYNPPPPNAHYLGLMLNGAEHWKLPKTYQSMLQNISIAL